MMQMKILRLEKLHGCTVGVLLIDGELHSCTLELPWRDNQRDVSCIPAGMYFCRRVESHRFIEAVEICDVPGRENILFHWGNTAEDTRGCVLIGRRAGWLLGRRAVMESRSAFLDLMKRVDRDTKIQLEIVEGCNAR